MRCDLIIRAPHDQQEQQSQGQEDQHKDRDDGEQVFHLPERYKEITANGLYGSKTFSLVEMIAQDLNVYRFLRNDRRGWSCPKL